MRKSLLKNNDTKGERCSIHSKIKKRQVHSVIFSLEQHKNFSQTSLLTEIIV